MLRPAHRSVRLLAVAAATAVALTACGTGDQAPDGAASASASAPSDHGTDGTDGAHDTGTPSPPASPSPLRAGEEFVTVGVADDLPGGRYVPDAPEGSTDDYRCFLADPGLTSDAFVTGVQFLPANPAVVHHSIVFRVEPDQVGAALEKDAEDERPGWECFGGPGLPSKSRNVMDGLDAAPWLAGWAPGGRENLFADEVGVPLSAGSQVVIQMHYNLRVATGDAAADNTQVRLRTSSRTDLEPLRTTLLPAPVELPCAEGQSGPLCSRGSSVADVVRRFGQGSMRTIGGLQLLCDGDPFAPKAGATQSCVRKVRAPETVRAAAGHMHLLGKSITIVANEGTSRERTLLDIPVWDFDDQSARPLDTPVALKPGDTITVTCTHDAALRDQLPSLQDVPDRYVVWGEGTTDEMCLGILLVTD
ncbi:monooxygenase [Longivirga aurantiaca]|uniref:Monooxygenase n=1 Tax=Longivirga aurantiaca TaxID=1837743 RepID=A0ABW1T2H1_9ACTN